MQVLVRDSNVDQALKALKKKLQREGVFGDMKLRDYSEKPSEKRAREKPAADEAEAGSRGAPKARTRSATLVHGGHGAANMASVTAC